MCKFCMYVRQRICAAYLGTFSFIDSYSVSAVISTAMRSWQVWRSLFRAALRHPRKQKPSVSSGLQFPFKRRNCPMREVRRSSFLLTERPNGPCAIVNLMPPLQNSNTKLHQNKEDEAFSVILARQSFLNSESLSIQTIC